MRCRSQRAVKTGNAAPGRGRPGAADHGLLPIEFKAPTLTNGGKCERLPRDQPGGNSGGLRNRSASANRTPDSEITYDDLAKNQTGPLDCGRLASKEAGRRSRYPTSASRHQRKRDAGPVAPRPRVTAASAIRRVLSPVRRTCTWTLVGCPIVSAHHREPTKPSLPIVPTSKALRFLMVLTDSRLHAHDLLQTRVKEEGRERRPNPRC